MPRHWTIAPLEHMVVCVLEGVVTLNDMMGHRPVEKRQAHDESQGHDASDRRLRVFRTLHDARRWLSNAPLDGSVRGAKRPL